MPCEEIGSLIAAGELLTPEQEAHVAVCPRCRAARDLVEALVAAPRGSGDVEAPPAPDAAALHSASVRRNVTRVATAAALAVPVALSVPFAAVWMGSPPPAGEQIEMDVSAALEQIEEATRGYAEMLPGTEALALLNPYAEPWSDPTILFEDALMGEGGR